LKRENKYAILIYDKIHKGKEKMVKNLLFKTAYTFYYFAYIVAKKFNKNRCENNCVSKGFIKFNNRLAIKRSKKVKIEKIALLLPHCIQNYSCPYKITSDIGNCRECGLCKIGEISKFVKERNAIVKIATGGTLARLFLKNEKPDFVVAVACERDLVAGIYDSFPMIVYGIFNKLDNGPCMNTDVSLEEIKKIFDLVGKK